MPIFTPFPVSGKVYDTDETLVTSGFVWVENFTKGTRLTPVSINSSGEYTADLANLSTGWNNEDVIYIYSKTNNKVTEARAQIASGDTYWEEDLYYRDGDWIGFDCRLVSIVISSTANVTVSFVERDSDRQLTFVNVAANETQSINFVGKGIDCKDGVLVLKAAQGTTRNNNTKGTANGIGDTTSNSGVCITMNLR